jgi:hypothetical protein
VSSREPSVAKGSLRGELRRRARNAECVNLASLDGSECAITEHHVTEYKLEYRTFTKSIPLLCILLSSERQGRPLPLLLWTDRLVAIRVL